MVGASKILTVSYGTFSCTLEGFEDSFDTMKAIAEYFRDLAADDRYFGAEPPTPDADMLARIAEREIARRVEARTEGAGIVLRAAPAPQETAPTPQPAAITAPLAAPAVAPVVAAQATAMPQVAPLAAPQPVPFAVAPAAAPSVTPAHEGESVAEKLQRIRAVVSHPAPVAAPVVEDETEDAQANDDIFAAFQMEEPPVTQPAAEPAAEPVVEATSQDPIAPQIEDQFAEQFEDDLPPAALAPEAPAMAEAEPFDLDALLADEVEDQADLTEVAAAEAATVAEDMTEDDDFAEDIIEALADEDDDFDAQEDIDDDYTDEAVIADLDDADFDDADLEDEDFAEATPAPADEPAARPYLLRVPRADVEDIIAEATAMDDLDGLEDEDIEDEAVYDDADFDEEPNMAELDGLGELGDMDGGAEESTLSAEDEADLQAELEDAAREARGHRGGRAIFERGPDAEDSISRLLTQADRAMNEPEGKGRRAAIAHLKAAVAATEAARRMGETEADENAGAEPFRDDLSQAVRPRRAPVRAEARTERPRPAPLRLVASQRIDLPAEDVTPRAPVAPVRPRRIQVSERVEPAAEPQQGFAKFAAAVGASELAELIEAAAVHTIHIEGFEDFTRPQLMTKVRDASLMGFSREDGLRHFGTLLREGLIERTANNRFTVSGESRFMTGRRAAQG